MLATAAFQGETPTEIAGRADAATDLHEARTEAVARAVVASGARSVLDLGCGEGALLARLEREPQFDRLAGVEASMEALGSAERRLGGAIAAGRVTLAHGSMLETHAAFGRFDAIALVETVEHLDPRSLSALEHALFARYRPALVIITTPNREYNALLGLADDALRHPGHRFEWTRGKFRHWASGVAARHGCRAGFHGIGPADLVLGAPTQMALIAR
jgi:small RNA 2'-O-methyltransferase